MGLNEIKWIGNETVDDLYEIWIRLVEAGNRHGLLKELARGANGGRRAHEISDDGSIEYVGPTYSSNDMTILELAYGGDANKIIEMVRESDKYEVGENLK